MLKPPASATLPAPASARSLERGALAERDLAAFATTPEAQRLAELEADKELVLRLGLLNFAGPEWNHFAHTLAAYGLQVIRAWVRKGEIFGKCLQKGLGGLTPLDRTAEDAYDLASETVARSI